MTNNNNLSLNIGLALSGGGYRAAGFHLGLLTYLNRVHLLSHVKMMSTVSGGTLTGAKYALSLVEDQSFKDFYQEYYQLLQTTDLIKLVLEKLGNKELQIPSARIDLITATAQVYAENFFKNAQGKPYRLRDIFDKNIAIEEIIFNATEFRYGLAFRFQCSNSQGRFGNGRISIPKSEAGDIRIADIVAASSCFPGGFEPIEFPDDFNWSNQEIFEKVKNIVHSKYPKSLALMDGGIYDNQAIESLYLADRRNNNNLDLLIISDVDNSPRSLYDFPDQFQHGLGDITLNLINIFSKIILLLAGVTVITLTIAIVRDWGNKQFNWTGIFLYIIPLILATATTGIIIWGQMFIKSQQMFIKSQLPNIGELSWQELKKLTIAQIIDAINLRLTSLQAMAGSVFMKRIRQMGLTAIYKSDGGKRRSKIIANFITDLKPGNGLVNLPPEVLPPSLELLGKIDDVAAMPTILWFTKDNQLENLIICGQATICYKLMVYIMRTHKHDNPKDPMVESLWHQLVADWNTLVTNPSILDSTLGNSDK